MNTFIHKGRVVVNKKWGFYLFAALMLWMKTYIVYKTQFNLGISGFFQEFLLMINPISSILLFLGIGLFFKKRNIAIIVIDLLMSILLYANVCFYRFFNDFITLPVLFQTKNFGDIGSSTFALMNVTDVFFFFDIIILVIIVAYKLVAPTKQALKRASIGFALSASLAIFFINLALVEIDRPQLLTRTFDRNYLVKYLGSYNFTVYDIVQNTFSSAQRTLADSSDLTEVENFTKANYTPPNPDYFGKAKGMNVIYISLESLQNFVIDYQVNGQEVTPFLNSLTHDENTFYFNNFFHQTGQGKTSDAEFMIENSLFPLPQGAVYMLKAQNTYQATPAILQSNGYTSAVFHGNVKTFWNRDEIYKSFGYEHFFDSNYYDMNTDDTLNYGLKDKPFFDQSIPMLKELPQPFNTKFISLSNHFPFPLDDGDVDFPPAETEDAVVNKYFQTSHYMDEALKQFFDDLKENNLYENTMIVMYGDHYGISENHNTAMEEILGKPIDSFENAQLQRVPLFIHIPGVDGQKVEKYGGEVDIRQTVMHLLGIDTKEQIVFGSDLLSNDHREIVPFRNGDFVTPEFTHLNEKLYDNASGEEVDKSLADDIDEFVKTELDLSDRIVYGDLLRFYDLPGFQKVNREDYNYNVNTK